MKSMFISKIWEKALMDSMTSDLKIIVWMEKHDVIGEIKEYQTLGRRYWYRKRILEKSIARKMRHWIEFMESHDKEERTIKIPKVGELNG